MSPIGEEIHVLRNMRRALFGEPLPTHRQSHERLSNLAALAVFASDGLSSVAYATEEILLILVLAGPEALRMSVPVALAIVALIAIVATSYRQVVQAYPSGGGAYAVAFENLGRLPGLVAASALMIDYALTVAVSVASGVAAITSAFPDLYGYRVAIGVLCIAVVAWANLRGARESARVFMVPTYGFVGLLLLTIVVGLFRQARGMGPVMELPTQSDIAVTQAFTMFLVLRAFASGCAALTGLEAVSNGVQAFKEPVARNASRVMTWLAVLLGVLFLGITVLVSHLHVVPLHHETVVSQITRATFGRAPLYYGVQFFTAVILILAANTSFNGFPRLASVVAADGYLPRQLTMLGDRLVFANGIVLLGAVSAILLAGFGGQTHRLIPLYAVGVFVSFTLAQAGLVVHWRKLRETQADWKRRAAINGCGAVVTAVVALVIAATKFTHGAWIVLIVMPALIHMMLRIRRHYHAVDAHLSLEGIEPPPPVRNLVIVLVGSVHRGMLKAVRYAASLAADEDAVRAVHIETESDRPRRSLTEAWDRFGLGIRLVVLKTDYRNLYEPLEDYIREVLADGVYDCVTLVLPEFVVHRWWEQILHNQTALRLHVAFHNTPGVVIANFRYYL